MPRILCCVLCTGCGIACWRSLHRARRPGHTSLPAWQGETSGRHFVHLRCVVATVGFLMWRPACHFGQVPKAEWYGTHSFRRGHARDLSECGTPLALILRAGQWRSAAFAKYLDEAELEKVGWRFVHAGRPLASPCMPGRRT